MLKLKIHLLLGCYYITPGSNFFPITLYFRMQLIYVIFDFCIIKMIFDQYRSKYRIYAFELINDTIYSILCINIILAHLVMHEKAKLKHFNRVQNYIDNIALEVLMLKECESSFMGELIPLIKGIIPKCVLCQLTI